MSTWAHFSTASSRTTPNLGHGDGAFGRLPRDIHHTTLFFRIDRVFVRPTACEQVTPTVSMRVSLYRGEATSDREAVLARFQRRCRSDRRCSQQFVLSKHPAILEEEMRPSTDIKLPEVFYEAVKLCPEGACADSACLQSRTAAVGLKKGRRLLPTPRTGRTTRGRISAHRRVSSPRRGADGCLTQLVRRGARA